MLGNRAGGRYLGPEIQRGRVWESIFIADLWAFEPKDYKERGGAKRRVDWGRMSMFTPPMQRWHQHFNAGGEPARYLALKPRGFKFKVEELRDTGEDVKNGGAQIEYQDHNPEIHRVFLAECKKSGAEPRMAMFG